MTKLTLNLEDCNNKEKQKAIDVICCYTKTQIDRNINCITVEIEDQVVSHLISSLPSSVTIVEQEKVNNNEITPQIVHHKPTGWIIISKEHYLELHQTITQIQKDTMQYEKLKSLYKDLMGTLAGVIDKFPYDV